MATCGSGWAARGEFCYVFVSAYVDHTGSDEHCQSIGGHLVYYEDPEESTFVASTVVGDQAEHFWIGQDMTFDNYAPGEPNGGYSCVESWPTGLWNDIPCSSQRPSVCKKHLYL